MSTDNYWDQFEDAPTTSSQNNAGGDYWDQFEDAAQQSNQITRGQVSDYKNKALRKVNPGLLGLQQFFMESVTGIPNLLSSTGNRPVGMASFMEIPEEENPFRNLRTPHIETPDLSKYVDDDISSKAQFYVGQYGPDVVALAGLLKPLLGAAGRASGLSKIGEAKNLQGELGALGKSEDYLSRSIAGREELLAQEQLQNAKKLGQESEQIGAALERKQAAFKSSGAKDEEAAIQNLTKSLTETRGKIESKIKADYERFGNDQSAGKLPVKDGINPSELNTEFESIKDIKSESLNQALEKATGKFHEIKSPHSDLPDQTYFQPSKSTVNDYLNLSKTARDEAFKIAEEIKNNKLLNKTEKEKMGQQIKALKKLQNKARNVVNKNISLEKRNELRAIDKEFEHKVVPFRRSNLLKQATAHQPKVMAENFMKKLINENKPFLKEHILKDHPATRKAIADFDLKNLDVTNEASIEKALKGAQGQALPSNVRKDLSGILGDIRQKDLVEKMLKHVDSSDISLAKNYPQINKILKKRPDLAKITEGPVAHRAQIAQMKKELEQLGHSKKDIETQLDGYRNYQKTIGNLASLFVGYKPVRAGKAVSNLRNINLPPLGKK